MCDVVVIVEVGQRTDSERGENMRREQGRSEDDDGDQRHVGMTLDKHNHVTIGEPHEIFSKFIF